MKLFVQNLAVICVLTSIVVAFAAVVYFAATQGVI